MKRQWSLPPSFFLKDILGSELKISWTFFTSWFAQQQEKYIVLQSNFFTSSLHFHCNIIACNNFHHNAGILIFCVNLFLQMKEIYHQNTLKNREIVWKFYISLILKNELKTRLHTQYISKDENVWNSLAIIFPAPRNYLSVS